MKINWTILLSSLIFCVFSPTYGRIHFRKLSAKDVYNALREAGRLDAVPEGRVVTQGIAAATGFLAGITKGIAIPMLAGLAFSSFNSNSNTPQSVWQEICFSSRSADQIDESKKPKNNENSKHKRDDWSEERQAGPSPIPPSTSAPTTNAPTTATPNPSTSALPPTTATTTSFPTTGTTGMIPSTATTATNPTTITGTTSPTTTATATATTTNGGTGTGTDTETTTQTGTGGSVNCIVVPKPVAG